MTNYHSLKMKKLQGKNGRGIGKILHIITLENEDQEREQYALVGVPQLMRRSIVSPLNLTRYPPVVTKKGDHVFIEVQTFRDPQKMSKIQDIFP